MLLASTTNASAASDPCYAQLHETEQTLERVLRLPHALVFKRIKFSSGCSLIVYKGSKPSGGKSEEEKEAKGNEARLIIEPVSPQPNPMNGTPFTQDATHIEEARRRLQGVFAHERRLPLPSLGAENVIGTSENVIGNHKQLSVLVGGLWWTVSTHKFIRLGLIESKKRPAIREFDQIARSLVPAFFA
jgi:hypothetical protein